MNNWSTRQLLGAGGLTFVILNVVGIVLFFMAGPPPGLADPANLVAYYQAHSFLLTTAILIFDLSLVPFIIFTAGLAAIIRTADPAAEWIGLVVFSLGTVGATEAFVHHGLVGAAIADGAGASNAGTVRTLGEASAYLTNTPDTVPMLFLLAAAAYAIWRTRVLPRWLSWMGWGGAILIAATVPSAYGGNDSSGFYTADGAVAIVALLILFAWTAGTSVAAIRAAPPSVVG